MWYIPKEKYKPWDIKKSDFPKNAPIQEKLRFLLKYSILAPSVLNTQPWRFQISDYSIKIYSNKSRQLNALDSTAKDMHISVGCSITNLLESAKGFGLETKVKLSSDQGSALCAEIDFEESKLSHSSLTEYIPKRFSDKGIYSKRSIPENFLSSLTKSSVGLASLILVSEGKTKSKIIELVEKADITLFSLKSSREDLSRWVKPSFSTSSYGMPGFTQGFNLPQSIFTQKILKSSKKISSVIAKKDKLVLSSSPYLGIIVVKKDGKEGWLEGGMLYEKLSLLATKESIRMTPLSAIIKVEETNKRLEQILGTKFKPIMFFRMGYSENKIVHTPRAVELVDEDTETRLIKSIPIIINREKLKILDYEINYIKSGKGPPLLLIHGGNIGWGQWFPNIAELANHFTIYALDLPGGGRSTKIDYSRLNPEKDLVEPVEKFISLQNLTDLNILGSSFSGWIILKIALRNKVRLNRLVLVDSIGFSDYSRPQDIMLSIYPLAKVLANTVLRPSRKNKNLERFLKDVFYDKSYPLTKEFLDYFYETMSLSHNLLFISKLINLRKSFILSREEIKKIKNQVFVVWGENDKLMPINKNLQNIKLLPDVNLKIIDEAGHFPSIERPKEFNEAIINFFSKEL